MVADATNDSQDEGLHNEGQVTFPP